MTPAKRKEKDLADELQESYEMRNDSEPSDDQERDQILTGPALQGSLKRAFRAVDSRVVTKDVEGGKTEFVETNRRGASLVTRSARVQCQSCFALLSTAH